MSVYVERFLKVLNLFCEIYILEVNVMSDIVAITDILIRNNKRLINRKYLRGSIVFKIIESGEFYTINQKFFHLERPLANAVKDITI